MKLDIQKDLSPRQADAMRELLDPDVKEILYGGAKGGGKTAFLVLYAFWYCLDVIQRFNLKPSKYPLPVGFIGRKEGTDCERQLIEEWKKQIPPEAYQLKTQPREIIIAGTVKLEWGGLDEGETVRKFQGTEYGFVGIDQAEETTRDDVRDLRASLRRQIDGVRLPLKALWTANPAQCWLKEDFVDRKLEGHRFVKALYKDNPWLPDDYVKTLRESYGHRPELLEAYEYGNWDVMAGADQIIKGEWVRKSRLKRLYPRLSCRLVVVDPARFGDDEMVMYLMKDTEIEKEIIKGQCDTMAIANESFVLSRENDGCPVVVDSTGLGAGVVDRLVEMGCPKVISLEMAGKAYEPERYYNLRAEMWDQVGRSFSDGQVAYHWPDSELMRQLQVMTYKYRNGRMLAESKADIKKRLSRSPDRADSYVMGLYALMQIRAKWHEQASGVVIYAPKSSSLPPHPDSMEGLVLREKKDRHSWNRRRAG